MSTIRSVFPVLFILIFSSWSSVVVALDEGFSDSQIVVIDEYVPESNWESLSAVSESVYQVRDFSGLIHSPFGDFDPLSDNIPLGPENLYDPSAVFRTGLVIIQSGKNPVKSLFVLLQLVTCSFVIASRLPSPIVPSCLEIPPSGKWMVKQALFIPSKNTHFPLNKQR